MKVFSELNTNKFHLTYKTHIDIKMWVDWANKKFSTIENYSFVNGIGDDTNGYLHTHILVEFRNKIGPKTPKIFNFKLEEDNEYWTNPYWEEYRQDKEKLEGIHPHVKIITDNNHWNNCVNYHLKHK